MPFRLQKATRDWFKDLSRAFELDFDMYYLCLVAGLATGRKADAAQSETTDLANEFPGGYRPRGRIIVALFLSREIQALGISLSERNELNNTIKSLVNPLSSTHLSEEGLRQMNRYAFGGFQVLSEQFGERPRAIETFLPRYKQFIDEHVNQHML